MAKSVLVTYLERNKVFTLPSSGSGLKLLEEQCRKEFKFDSSVEVTFQRLEVDSDWGEIYLDLCEDSTINHKDRVKLVVTPVLAPPKDSSKICSEESVSTPLKPKPSNFSPYEISSEESVPTSGTKPHHSSEVSLEQDFCTPLTSKPHSLDADRESVSSEEEIHVPTVRHKRKDPLPDECEIPEEGGKSVPVNPKRPKFVKTEEDAVPLPDPFPLPKHYRADVEVALANGRMTKSTTSSFLSSVASAMLVHKRYPTHDDYVGVARTIVQKYSFMASPVGTPYGAIVMSLTNRFKEFRRQPVNRTKPSVKRSPKKKSPGITQCPVEPRLPPGEDSVSCSRHNRVLLVEFNKTRHNKEVVTDLMDKTFALRRKKILETSPDLNSLFKEYPFLQDGNQLVKELDRILEQPDAAEKARVKWLEIAPKVLEQARLESHKPYVDTALNQVADIEEYVELAALVVLPSLLPDSRVKMDITKIIQLAKGCTDVKAVAKDSGRLEPYIAVVGSESLDAYLVVDQQVIDKVPSDNLPYVLMAAFFVYNICYPKGCNNFYSFLEVAMLGYSAEKASPSVSHLLAKLSAH